MNVCVCVCRGGGENRRVSSSVIDVFFYMNLLKCLVGFLPKDLSIILTLFLFYFFLIPSIYRLIIHNKYMYSFLILYPKQKTKHYKKRPNCVKCTCLFTSPGNSKKGLLHQLLT